MSINDATPQDWERLQEEIPAIEKTGLEAWDTPEEDMVNSPSHYTYGKVE